MGLNWPLENNIESFRELTKSIELYLNLYPFRKIQPND